MWETPQNFLTTESILYDHKREVLYVTSFDNQYDTANKDEDQFTGYISKVTLDGEIETLRWISHLSAPCGKGIYRDRLYTVERGFLTEIDIESGTILKRYPVTGSDFLNDLVIDAQGNTYMSDTSPSNRLDSRIYKFADGEIEVWERGHEIDRTNGLFVHGDYLLVGNTGDGCLQSIHLSTKKINTITCLGAGVVDGIRVDNDGNYLVSHREGQLYVVSPDGYVTEVPDTLPQGQNVADFEFIKDKNLIIIPTFVANGIVARLLD